MRKNCGGNESARQRQIRREATERENAMTELEERQMRKQLGSKTVRLHRLSMLTAAASVILAIGGATILGTVTAAAAQSADKVSVRLDYYAGPEQAGFWVAKAKGWYAAAGLNVDVKEGQGSDSTAQLVAAGRETFGFVTGDALLRANSKGASLMMVAMPIQDSGLGFAVRKDSDIRSPKDLVGKSYADSPGSAGIGLLRAVCEVNKIDCGKIKIVTLPTQAVIPGFLEGKFDAVVSNDWWPSGYTGSGPVRFINYRDHKVPSLGWGIVATKKTLSESGQVARKFVQATMRGFDYAFANPKELHGIIAKQVKKYYYDEAANVAALSAFVTHTANAEGKALGWMSLDDWKNAIAVLTKYAGLKNAPAAKDVFTNQYIQGN